MSKWREKKEIACWRAMMARCYKKHHPYYDRYGGRGIKVCTRWHDSDNFLADMGDAPETCSLDRIDNDKGYSPSNCRWTAWDVRASNRGINRFYFLGDKQITLSELAKITGDKNTNLWKQLNWDLKTPDDIVAGLFRPNGHPLTTEEKAVRKAEARDKRKSLKGIPKKTIKPKSFKQWVKIFNED